MLARALKDAAKHNPKPSTLNPKPFSLKAAGKQIMYAVGMRHFADVTHSDLECG